MAKTLKGTIISDAMDKTVVVLVERYVKHPKYKKYIKRSKKYHAHDEENIHKKGEIIEIQECKPMSKNKSWEVLNKKN